MEENKLVIDFSYIDEFGQQSKLFKTLNSCVLNDMDTFDLLLDEFKNFMISAGFSKEHVAKIIEVD